MGEIQGYQLLSTLSTKIYWQNYLLPILQIKSLYDQGFRRFGIGKGKNYIHVDNDPTKTQNITFGYPSGAAPIYTIEQIASF